jgi:RNA polymerase sigma-70 factor, ECF subfamily
MDMEDFKRALLELPDDQREALILVGGSGFAYEEAAEICGVAVGTIKSRVSRARGKLAQVLDMNPPPKLGSDVLPEAIFATGGRR